MDTPKSDSERKEFDEALLQSFRSDPGESIHESQRRLLLEIYSMGRRHERNNKKGAE